MSRDLNPYEEKRWSELPDGVMRPGGLSLTVSLLLGSALIPPAEILDLGCGIGGSAGLLRERGFEVTGLDRSGLLLHRARIGCPEITFLRGDAAALPFEDKAFDGILAECVLSCAGANAVLKECSRVLRPGGTLMLSDLYRRSPTGTAEEDGSLLTWEGWGNTLEREGFSIVAWTDETPALTEFVLTFLLRGGTREELFDGAGLPGGKVKIGYFALAAVRRPETRE